MDKENNVSLNTALTTLLEIVNPTSKPNDFQSLVSKLSVGGSIASAEFKQAASVFDHLKRNKPEKPHFLPLDDLSLNAIEDYLQAKTDGKEINELMEYLNREISQVVSDDNPERRLEKVLSAIRQFGWCVSSVEGVSLYDHARMAAALAVCLPAATEIPEAKLKEIEQGVSDESIALLVGGDISGVQDFIYSITNKGAVSALRGRSFYLQALTEALARYVLGELGLPITNLIYGGGGNFYILARAGDEAKIEIVQKKISRILYKYHHGDLYLALGSVSLNAGNFMPKNEKSSLSAKWGELARELAKAKNGRFSELDVNELEALFIPEGNGGNEDNECKACGREFPNGAGQTIKSGDDDVVVCKSCGSYVELGESLRKARYISLEVSSRMDTEIVTVAGVPHQYQGALLALGLKIGVHADIQGILDSTLVVWALDDDAFSKFDRNRKPAVTRHFLTNVAPRISKKEIDELRDRGVEDLPKADDKDKPIKPFGAMAAQAGGIKRLGILRMDVDDLGKLFAEGLGSDASLAHIASLSFAVSLFFEGWVGELAKRRNQKCGDLLYAIYSGGDDLFFVGAWDQSVELAIDIRRDLDRYTGDNPFVHASGGIALIHDKYPLAKAAADAEVAEKKAKALDGKDAFCFLGMPLPWRDFGVDECVAGVGTAHQLMHLLEKEDDHAVNRNVLDNYASYAEVQREREIAGKVITVGGKRQTLFGPWNWRIYYSLREKMIRKPALGTFAEHFHKNPASIEQIALAARWAELINRSNKGDK